MPHPGVLPGMWLIEDRGVVVAQQYGGMALRESSVALDSIKCRYLRQAAWRR